MANTDVEKKQDTDVAKTAGRTPETQTTYVPDVDIREDGDNIRLLADMPGVDQGSVSVTVENNVLTIEGTGSINGPEGYELAGAEYGVGRYRRDFTLSNAVDADGIKARVRHGVLTVTVPKQEAVKTRKIEIEN